MSTLGVEIWTPLYSFVNNSLSSHDKYEISNLGRVRHVINKKFLVPSIVGAGYKQVYAYAGKKNGRTYTHGIRLNRSVATSFYGPPPNQNEITVDHIDGDSTNDKLSNLRWCSHILQNSNRIQHIRPKQFAPVVRGDGLRFESITDATRYMKFKSKNSIASVLAGKNITAGGFTWAYEQKNTEDLLGEQWAQIADGKYVSSSGRIKDITKNIHVVRTARECITPSGLKHNKYPIIHIYKKGVSIHRLVAEHFVPNDDPENKTIVHHKDGDRLNANANNLEWVTYSYNNTHSNTTRNTM
jgi:hypothetical protein